MNLQEKIDQDILEAMKNGDEKTRDILRYFKSILKRKEIDLQKELTEQDVIAILSKEIKSHQEAIEQFKTAGRDDLTSKEEEEIKLLSKYLPEQLSDEELNSIIKKAVEETGASEMSDMGKVMAKVMPQTQGKADGAKISQIVKDLLSK